jgi:uncharacterized protein YbaR (Trm112 family)
MVVTNETSSPRPDGCPKCHAHLSQTCEVFETSQVTSGVLACTNCGESYPIEAGIPRFVRMDEPAEMQDIRLEWVLGSLSISLNSASRI